MCFASTKQNTNTEIQARMIFSCIFHALVPSWSPSLCCEGGGSLQPAPHGMPVKTWMHEVLNIWARTLTVTQDFLLIFF